MKDQIHSPSPIGVSQDLNDRSTGNPEITQYRLTNIAWQRILMPLTALILIVLTAFFCWSSFRQYSDLQKHSAATPMERLSSVMDLLAHDSTAEYSEKLEAAKWWTLASLEANTMENRFHQGNTMILLAIWTRYLGFITGMVLSLVGAMFVLGRLRESQTTLTGEGRGWKISVLSSSPGLVLVILGSVLMLTTILKQTQLDVTNSQLLAEAWMNPPIVERFESKPTQSGQDTLTERRYAGETGRKTQLTHDSERTAGGGSSSTRIRFFY
jgi:hypothetical protein